MKYRSPLLAGLAIVLCYGVVEAQALSLLKTLGDLGVSPAQALGGAQALMGVAKTNLGADEFSQLLGGAPELGQVMEMSSADSALGGLMGGGEESGDVAAPAMAADATDASGVGNLDALMANANLVKQFTDLGMDAAMIAKFVPGLLGVAGGGNADTLGLLRKGLGIL